MLVGQIIYFIQFSYIFVCLYYFRSLLFFGFINSKPVYNIIYKQILLHKIVKHIHYNKKDFPKKKPVNYIS